MKKIIFLSILLFTVFESFSQVNFENLSFDGALQKSKQTGKLIFIQFESAGCEHCNEVADKAFNDKKLSETLEQTFICIKISPSSPDRSKIASLYNKKDGFGSLFVNSDGTLLHSFNGSTTLVKTYEEHIDNALTKAGEGMKLNELEKEYRNGNTNPGLMELLLQVKNKLNLDTDSLLDQYVSIIPADSLISIRTIQFIASMAPVLDSKTDVKFRTNPSFNKAWYEMPLSSRVSINGRIGYKSMQKAVREKNEIYAYRVAGFIKNTYTNSPQAAQKAFDSKMIEYYKQIKDTSNYLIRSIYYYDNYYMTVSVDSIKRKDSLTLANMFAKQTTASENNGLLTQKVISFAPSTQYFNRDLNNAAYSFYEWTNDPLHLAKALQWSSKANQFCDSYASMDTHAHLLYKLGKKDEAIEWQNKAIAFKKKQGFDTKSLEKELGDMKSGKIVMIK